MFVEQAAHCFRRAVTTGETGAAGDQHHLYDLVGDPVGNLRANLVEVIFEQDPAGQVVSGSRQAVNEQLA
ncbi:hypothetical protein D3C73_1597450 [compost metagenome]